MASSISGTKKLIKRQIRYGKIYDVTYPFIKNSKIYVHTNENIDECFKYFDFRHINNALVVLSSGDYIFNLLANNVLNIDAFDTNQLTEYYVFGLKMALIKKYNYYEYLNILKRLTSDNISVEETTDIILGLIPYMEEKYQKHWTKIVLYNKKKQENREKTFNLLHLIGYETHCSNLMVNTYLKNEENYNLVKENLKKANISFKCANAVNLHKDFNGKYDLILLSNILDFLSNEWGDLWGYRRFKELTNNLHTITSDNGTILLAYAITPELPKVIGHSSVKINEIEEETHEIPSFHGHDYKDVLILSRKRKECVYGNEDRK